MNKNSWYAALTWIAIILLLFTFSIFRNRWADSEECPEKILGNVNGSLSIKYFQSPFCVYCWLEEPIIKSLVEQKGDLFSISYYDIRYCNEETDKYKITGTPSFVFDIDGEEQVIFGYIPRDELTKKICELSGGCPWV